MKLNVKIGYLFTSVLFLTYLSVPNSSFPEKTIESLQSDEPADTEDLNRRSYFTNMNRAEIMSFYLDQMNNKSFLGITMPTYRLNYPPEEAQKIIRDQTRSTFLEEIVHPFRESVFVNGFEPTNSKDEIFINEKVWRQKITVKQVESNLYFRLIVGFFCVVLIPVIFDKFTLALKEFGKEISKLWIYR